MSDKFTAAVEELGAAISVGEDIEGAIAEIAAEHDLRPVALRNRAERSLGDLTTYRERHNAVASGMAQATREREELEKTWRKTVERMQAQGYSKADIPTFEGYKQWKEFLRRNAEDWATKPTEPNLEESMKSP